MLDHYQNSDAEINIWLIEDHRMYRENLEKLICETPGLNCEKSFENCEDVLKELENAWVPEVFLVDIGLPGMSGLEGIEKIKKIAPGSQIIMLTIYDDADKIFNALCKGASGYLLKSSSVSKILESIQDVVNGGFVMNASIAKKVVDMFANTNLPKNDYKLTEREKQILDLMVKGLTKKKIADQLFLSFHTIDTHLRSIYNKLHVNSKSGAIAKTIKEKIV